jgi:cytochrome c biogenesis protein CcdA
MILAAELSHRALGVGLLVSAIAFGFRHGFDWDHLAAITDLTSSQPKPRRSMFLATMYALGHAIVVVALGVAAIAFSEQLPSSVDTVMGRVVGVTLVMLGLYILVAVVREGRNFRMRSRWMLVILALRRATRVLVPRSRRAEPEAFVIEHDHEHEHDHAHAHPDEHLAPAMAAVALHEHSHAQVAIAVPSRAVAEAEGHHRHAHRHRHVLHLPGDPLPTYGVFGALGIGVLHGIGAETPTQIVIFAGAAGVAGLWSGLLVLAAFVLGLVVANTTVAAAAAFGFLGSTRRAWLYVALSLVTAACSLAIGTLFILDRGDLLPVIFSG